MVAFYNINDISLGTPSHSGHEIYLDAHYNPDGQKIVYKKNKHGLSTYSRLEVSFSQLAKLFLFPGLTPSQRVVVDDAGDVVGLAVQHLRYVIEDKEGLKKAFYTLEQPQSSCTTTEQQLSDSSEIPIYFLDKLPQGFYASLLQAQKESRLTLDYDSLASILTTSYTLEEDDLHKGNFGFYIIKKNKKPHVVFFKIDHDLMFADSIMGFQSRRLFHLFHDHHAFDITAEDLLDFPNLKNSANTYWPTRFSYISNPFGKKEYHSFAENAAFARLAHTPEFKRAKWKAFYKHILIPTQLIGNTLKECANHENTVDRAHTALITHALVTRLAHLRAVLFSIKEFRDVITGLTDQENEALLREIIPVAHPMEVQIKRSFAQYKEFCLADKQAEEGDTPLHTAIKLGEYRYEETLRMFGHFINTRNKAGKTPLDEALTRMYTPQSSVKDVGRNMHFIMQHLLANGAQKTPGFKKVEEQIENYTFTNPYKKNLTANTTYSALKNSLRDIGEDHRFCLKYKKNLAIECINRWIQLRQDRPAFQSELERLKRDVNGTTTEAEAAGLKYLRQLRSKLWIIRQLRGLYGLTSTQWEINKIIDKAQHSLSVKARHSPSFFSESKKPQKPANLEPVSLSL